MNIKSVQLNENLKVHFFFPDFNDDVAIIKERKTCFRWVADPLFSIPRQLLVFIVAIENLPEVSVPYKQTTVDFYKNHNENTTLQVSDTIELSDQSVRNSVIMSCPIKQYMKINEDFLKRRGNLNSSGVFLTSMTICRSRNLIGIVTIGKMRH